MTTLCINPQCPEPQNVDDRDRCQACSSRLLLGQRFRPVEELGRGGFGRTFLAWDEAERPPQKCVIKQIVRSRGGREQDVAEAKRLADLGQHPQIPTLIAILESTRDLCLVQSYVAGQNLEQLLQSDGRFNEAQGRSLLLALLPVLQFIHGRGIIHRDIKPENIVSPGADQLPVLVDFGAARTAPTATELEHTGTVIGSAGYAAPEQALGKAVPASDLYGLGITCLHLLTGQHPFDLYSVAVDQWVWRDFVTEPLSQSFGNILNRLVARSLRSRYASADAVLTDLAPAGILAARVSKAPLVPTRMTWRCTQVWQTPGKTPNAIALSPNGRAIATANRDRSAQLWERQTGTVIHTFAQRLGWGQGHADAVTAVAFHPDGQHLFTAGQDGTIQHWDLTTYQRLAIWRQPDWQITAIALTADGKTLITAGIGGRISVWDLGAGKRQFDLVRHAGTVHDLALSADGSRLASVGEDSTLRLWALPSGQLLHTWTGAVALQSVAISATAPAIITGDRSGKFVAWSLTDFAEKTELTQTQDAASAIALSSNEQWLALGSRDRTLQIWQWRGSDRRCIANLQHDWGITDLVFTADGNTLVSAAGDETIRFWQGQL
ncbi:MAG: protein kinase [Leptolyngbyaceae cyanobacterium]